MSIEEEIPILEELDLPEVTDSHIPNISMHEVKLGDGQTGYEVFAELKNQGLQIVAVPENTLKASTGNAPSSKIISVNMIFFKTNGDSKKPDFIQKSECGLVFNNPQTMHDVMIFGVQLGVLLNGGITGEALAQRIRDLNAAFVTPSLRD